jgi:hypothetical protein
MGVMNFLLPAGLSPDALRELGRASVAGGQDTMPYPTAVQLRDHFMTLRRGVDESGMLLLPWPVDDAGQLMFSSATLMERPATYYLPLELARGKVNQVRSQAADWLQGGLDMPAPLAELLRDMSLAFGRAVVDATTVQGPQASQRTLTQACQSAEFLVQTYINQVFQIRHQRQVTLDTELGCRLAAPPATPEQCKALTAACNAFTLIFPWDQIEPTESEYRWETADALVEWATAQNVPLAAGPLIDFSGAGLPEWLWKRERDLSSLAGFLCDYVETVIQRYRTRIRTWTVTAASNASQTLAVADEELLWLTVRLIEAARNVDPTLNMVVSIAQPWGDYMVTQEHTHSPFVFADTLVRTGLKLAALDLEFIMGVTPRGSYCRDRLDMSRLLDLYALLGVPLQVTLGYPSASGKDQGAHPDLATGGGHWKRGLDPETQATWAAAFGELAVCKQFVRGVNWVHLADNMPHLVPHCGLMYSNETAKPALARLQALREQHLK